VSLSEQLSRSGHPLTLAGVPAGFLPLLLGDLAREAGRLVTYVAADEAEMRGLADTIGFFAPGVDVHTFPAWDCLPYDRASPSLRIGAERFAALHALQRAGAVPRVLLTTVNALCQRTVTPFRVRQAAVEVAVGDRFDRDRLATALQVNGYQRTDTVADAGEYTVRGGLIDIFTPGETAAVRLDYFGDEIESIRRFEPGTQRTIGKIERAVLLPVSEVLLDPDTIARFRRRYRERFGAVATGDPLYQAVSDARRLAGIEHWLPLFEERLAGLAEHTGPDGLWIASERARQAADARFEAIADYHNNRARAAASEAASYRPIDPAPLYLSAEEFGVAAAEWPIHITTAFDRPASDAVVAFGVTGPRDFAPERTQAGHANLAVADHARACWRDGKALVIACYSEGSRDRLAAMLREAAGIATTEAESWTAALSQGRDAIALVLLPLDHGFTAESIALLSEQDVLGDRLIRRARKRKDAKAFLDELATLSPRDLVVHSDHGIGRYLGLASIPVGAAPHDCVALEYAGGDKLYVPIENLDVLTRFGGDGVTATLDRLGGEAWQRRKAKTRERIREIAGKLLATAAARALRKAEAITPDDTGFRDFVNRFPYAETDDQDRAIGEVIDDLAAGRPMDRLVVGDVGFGKTEVALRAAFIAAMAGKQVALVCPTTLLARQHSINFTERFHGFPLKIGQLSRLVPAAEAKAVRDGLADGTVDIVIGTHALLAKSVAFKRLGLVIVDEEQHFGVVHKERLKALKADVHVLTLTATPIPRTLQMAMSGLRSLSVIQTPPIDRLAVRTYVMPFDPVVIREALLREHHRGGQSFFVVPRIADLPEIESFLREHVPEVRAIVAHGQMAPTMVEDHMNAFYDKRYDVLVSTTIVESGLDIPSANTLIVHRADRFGLAQLYQLRGRVGRSKTRAYAYLTTPVDSVIGEVAEKRLKVLSDLDTLGAGFQLASHDLDLRGAGNLLGDEQSGHIREVGFELYQSMLEEAIIEAKAGGAGIAPADGQLSPQITIDVPILIPEDYVPDLDVRMGLYRRLNDIDDLRGIEAFAAEMIDRFGKLPGPSENLLRVIGIKLHCRKARIAKIDAGPRGALVSFADGGFPDVAGLLGYVERLRGTARLRPDSKLVITRDWTDPAQRLAGVAKLAQGLAKILD